MCCLRKSPFHRKNVTKLLQHPYIQQKATNKLEKSFDDVSELDFGERPRSVYDHRRPSSRRSYRNIGNNNELTPVRVPDNTVAPRKDPNADLINILKKIEAHKKEEPTNSMQLLLPGTGQRPKSQNVAQKFTHQASRNESAVVKKSPEIDFLQYDAPKSREPRRPQVNAQAQGLQGYGVRVTRPGGAQGNVAHRHVRMSNNYITRPESRSDDISSSEFI